MKKMKRKKEKRKNEKKKKRKTKGKMQKMKNAKKKCEGKHEKMNKRKEKLKNEKHKKRKKNAKSPTISNSFGFTRKILDDFPGLVVVVVNLVDGIFDDLHFFQECVFFFKKTSNQF